MPWQGDTRPALAVGLISWETEEVNADSELIREGTPTLFDPIASSIFGCRTADGHMWYKKAPVIQEADSTGILGGDFAIDNFASRWYLPQILLKLLHKWPGKGWMLLTSKQFSHPIQSPVSIMSSDFLNFMQYEGSHRLGRDASFASKSILWSNGVHNSHHCYRVTFLG